MNIYPFTNGYINEIDQKLYDCQFKGFIPTKFIKEGTNENLSANFKIPKIQSEHYAVNHFFTFFSIHFPLFKKQHIKTLCNFLKSKIKLKIMKKVTLLHPSKADHFFSLKKLHYIM